MQVSKTVKWIAGSVFGTFTLLFIVLVVHIATAKPVALDNATMQISRIDFKEPIDEAKAKEIHRNLKSIAGVMSDRLNKDTGVLVFFHDNRIANSEKIYNELMSKGNYKAERYVIAPELASKKVCPAINTNSFSYKFSRGIQRIFN